MDGSGLMECNEILRASRGDAEMSTREVWEIRPGIICLEQGERICMPLHGERIWDRTIEFLRELQNAEKASAQYKIGSIFAYLMKIASLSLSLFLIVSCAYKLFIGYGEICLFFGLVFLFLCAWVEHFFGVFTRIEKIWVKLDNAIVDAFSAVRELDVLIQDCYDLKLITRDIDYVGRYDGRGIKIINKGNGLLRLNVSGRYMTIITMVAPDDFQVYSGEEVHLEYVDALFDEIHDKIDVVIRKPRLF